MPVSLTSAHIRGIRSYSPDVDKTQTIDFMPLTLIVGSNGSGKTTIIESLKFIISGEEPPLSDSRRNFMHTSKLSHSADKNTTYSSIELRFSNNKDNNCIARRDITKPSVTNKNATPSITSCYKIGSGKWNHVHRQDEWSKTVPHLFNLPNQALINNVMLCHQDDNLWCMGDSSTVKQVFDRIFGCEQYKKEIKHIELEIKSCKTDIIVSEKEEFMYREKVEAHQQLKKDLINKKQEVDQMLSEEKKINSRINQFMADENDLSNRLKELEPKLRAFDSLNNQLTYCTKTYEDLKNEGTNFSIIDRSLLPDSELKSVLADHTGFVVETKKKQDGMRAELNSVKNEIKNHENRKSATQVKINQHKVIQMRADDSYNRIMNSLQKIKTQNDLESLDLSDISNSIKLLNEFDMSLVERKSESSELENSLSEKQNKLSKNICNLEGIYQGLMQKIHNKENYIKTITDQLSKASPMATNLTVVSENLAQMSLITDQLPNTPIVDSLGHLIVASKKIIDDICNNVQKDSILNLNGTLKVETESLAKCREELVTTKLKKKELVEAHDLLCAEHQNSRTASKEAHNKLITFRNAQSMVEESYTIYQKERKIADSDILEEYMLDIKDIDSKIEHRQQEVNSLDSDISKLSEEIEKNYRKCAEYKYNLRIRESQDQIAELRSKLDLLSDSESQIKTEIRECKFKLSECSKEQLEFRESRSKMKGSMIQIEKDIQRLEHELKSHVQTNSRYAEALGKLVCNKIVIGDLEKLRECFQHSIITFHNQMIAKINEVLRIRWRQIYVGSDIDYIELVDEEITRGKDKRAYNYYVAMHKDGFKMKMREKSSAGQKALASIILKMTLAELFVKDFAFIALDEPTTNLDLSNIKSLAKTIGAYVRRRSQKGANIQWIIITHDETFLRALDQECSPYYYRIQMTNEGWSKIDKIAYQEPDSVQGSMEST